MGNLGEMDRILKTRRDIERILLCKTSKVGKYSGLMYWDQIKDGQKYQAKECEFFLVDDESLRFRDKEVIKAELCFRDYFCSSM